MLIINRYNLEVKQLDVKTTTPSICSNMRNLLKFKRKFDFRENHYNLKHNLYTHTRDIIICCQDHDAITS